MKDILEKIIDHKRPKVEYRKKAFPIVQLEKSVFFERDIISIKEQLMTQNASGIIAEFKRKSPSKGEINITSKIGGVTQGYIRAGASALSVLTDEDFFGGRREDLVTARSLNQSPILRKDFIFDEYQIFEAKSIGADVILLIAEVLTKNEIELLSSRAKSLGLEVLMELHSQDQLAKLNANIDILGVNNRNLKTFEVSIENSIRISKYLPKEVIRISESGINSPEDILKLKGFGYKGFLIGERFMKTQNPEKACSEFIEKLF